MNFVVLSVTSFACSGAEESTKRHPPSPAFENPFVLISKVTSQTILSPGLIALSNLVLSVNSSHQFAADVPSTKRRSKDFG